MTPLDRRRAHDVGLGLAIANEVAEVCVHIASCLWKPGPGFEELLDPDLDAWSDGLKRTWRMTEMNRGCSISRDMRSLLFELRS